MRGCALPGDKKLQTKETCYVLRFLFLDFTEPPAQGLLRSPQLSRRRATKRLAPFSNILRILGSLLSSLYFLPWILLNVVSWLPRAARQPGRALGRHRTPLRLQRLCGQRP